MSNTYQIDKVILYHCVLPIHMRYSTDSRQSADVLIVEMASGNQTGWGEVFLPRLEPLWGWARRVTPMLVGHDAALLDRLIDTWPDDRPKMKLADCGTYCHPNVDCVAEAVSIALHDLVARATAVRFADLLGTVSRTEIPGMPVVTLAAPEAMAIEAAGWCALGVRFLKIKLSGAADHDVAALRQIRSKVGAAVDLQVDANGAYTDMAQTAPVLDALNAADVLVVEDLFDVGNNACLRASRKHLTGRIMLDKEAHWPHVNDVLALGLVDIINQHPHNQGSMTNALRIAAAARAAGVENAIGSSGLLGIQNTAFLHLASVTGLTRPCEDIGMHTYHDSPVDSALQFEFRPTVLADPVPMRSGMMALPHGPGLGVTVDRDALGQVTLDVIQIT